MGLETLASVGLTAAQNSQTMSNAKSQANAAVQQAGIEADNTARKTDLAAGTQTNRFLSSGLQLIGTPQADAAGTYSTGLADAQNIINNGNAQSKNIYSQARSKMIAGIAGQVKGLGLGGLDLGAGATSALSYLPDSFAYSLNSAGDGSDAFTALEKSDARGGNVY